MNFTERETRNIRNLMMMFWVLGLVLSIGSSVFNFYLGVFSVMICLGVFATLFVMVCLSVSGKMTKSQTQVV